MADEKTGTHATDPGTGDGNTTPELVNRMIDNHEVEVSPELATILDEQKAHYAEQQTKAQTMMADAKAHREKTYTDLKTDVGFYRDNNNQKAWDSYVPLVEDGNGYRGDPALLGASEPDITDGDEPDAFTKQKAMTPDPNVAKNAEWDKRMDALELRIDREAGQKTLGVMDGVLIDPKFVFANRTEVLDRVKRYYDDTGKQPTRKDIIDYATSSHDTMKAKVTKAGDFVEKPRFDGASPPGGMPREKVKGVPGNIFGTQAERQASVEYLANQLTDF